jgi:Ca2+-transporting ATPase
MVTVHDAAADQKLVIVKGDPSEVLALCRWRLHNGIIAVLEDEGRRAIEDENLAMARDALRVLGIAYRSAGVEDRGTSIERNFIWTGLVGMADPIRKGAPDLIDAFRRAGITSIMLTGDQRATAAAVADELGLSNGHQVEIIEAGQLEEFQTATADGDLPRADLPRVFARVAPGQKLQLVKKLQRGGRVVAMIGDGVNDTPPLRAADIGIALGRSGGEAARGIADVVLLEDDLASLTDAVERGRTVAINIRNAIRYLVATNLSEIIFMLVAAAAGRAHPLSPIQLLWINLLTDVLPALGLAMEPAAPDLMTRPPRDPEEPVISAAEFGTLARDAGLIAASAFAAQACAARLGGSAQSGQTIGFTSLVSAQLFYAFACRSRRGSILPRRAHPPNPFFFGALGCAFAAQGAALFVPGLRNLFGPALGIVDFGISLAAGAAPLLAVEVLRKAQSHPT